MRYQRASQDKKEQGKSVSDQGNLNLAEIHRNGWSEAASFTDNNLSASRHATKEREDFERMMDGIRAGRYDVLVVWEVSRKERDLAVFVKIRDLCHEVGLYFWLVGGVLFDLRDKNDRMMLGFQAVQAEWLADSIRDNVLRGINGAAEAGRPHGKVTYGYRRIYDQRTKALLRQEPDTETRQAVAADGTVTEYSHAQVVRDNFRKISEGMPLTVREAELNQLGIPAPQGGVWRRGVLRKQVMNPAYIGKRVLRGEIVGDGIWPALVDEETYWSVVRMLADPSRTTTRPARAVHLLSYIVRCGVCGGPLSSQKVNRHGWTGQVYSCLHKRCAAVKAEYLDEYVQRVVVAWLSRPDVYEILSTAGASDEEAAFARAEAQRLRGELEDWRKLGEEGDVTAIAYARAEKRLLAKIAEHEQRAAEAGVPAVLRGRIGDQAVPAWQVLGDDVAVKREIIRLVADIKLLRAGFKGERRSFGRHRLDWRWKFGPQDQQAA
ncbi:recombinase family protein [Micromonospora polyrhachis]|uniref:DNA invertase Pin-like site-specific DNA recombinase n=1 Tax=Micromonospora polyrhachis TaxID=1282883 RepID=A0A7W7STF7_9ACTN|nr:recombinase family protein [Micromonospora polyrhachis]MBB4960251.1 DNA invertase Pin-like site-specific DNA recombinase [Micromonospora polyrhachis]